MGSRNRETAYWRANLLLVGVLLTLWFAVSFGCGILFVDALDRTRIAGFPLGFWWAQQGSMYVFVLLIVVYAAGMHWLDHRFGMDRRRAESTTTSSPDPAEEA